MTRLVTIAVCLAAGSHGVVAQSQPRATDQGKAEPPVDRSGEHVLKEIFANYGKLYGVRATLLQSTREERGGPFFTDHSMKIEFRNGTVFAIEQSGMWGDALRVVSDGKTVLRDSLGEWEPIQLKDTPKSIAEADENLQPGKDYGTPLFLLLEGPPGMEKLLAPKTYIKVEEAGTNWSIVRFKSKLVGETALWFKRDDPRKLIRVIDYDNRAAREELARNVPEWFTMPAAPLTRQEIIYHEIGADLPDDLFVTTPPPGRTVDDKRTKPKKLVH